MAVAQRMSEADYEQFIMNGAEGAWELHDGQLVEKPGMTFEHGDLAFELGHLLRTQLDRRRYRIAINDWRLRWSSDTIFIPDVVVVPVADSAEFRGQPGRLAVFSQPLPLVVEVWSLSTGNYDIAAKLPVYQQRGDLEIWLLHPYDRTLTTWRRQADGSYRSSVHRSGLISPMALPGVTIDLALLFAA